MAKIKFSTRKQYKSGVDQHKKIANARGSKWKANLIKGKREALLHPSLLRIARLQKGLDQEDIAKKLNISTSAWGAIERGKQPIKGESANLIAKLFGKPTSFFFKSSDVKGKFVANLQKTEI